MDFKNYHNHVVLLRNGDKGIILNSTVYTPHYTFSCTRKDCVTDIMKIYKIDTTGCTEVYTRVKWKKVKWEELKKIPEEILELKINGKFYLLNKDNMRIIDKSTALRITNYEDFFYEIFHHDIEIQEE